MSIFFKKLETLSRLKSSRKETKRRTHRDKKSYAKKSDLIKITTKIIVDKLSFIFVANPFLWLPVFEIKKADIHDFSFFLIFFHSLESVLEWKEYQGKNRIM